MSAAFPSRDKGLSSTLRRDSRYATEGERRAPTFSGFLPRLYKGAKSSLPWASSFWADVSHSPGKDLLLELVPGLLAKGYLDGSQLQLTRQISWLDKFSLFFWGNEALTPYSYTHTPSATNPNGWVHARELSLTCWPWPKAASEDAKQSRQFQEKAGKVDRWVVSTLSDWGSKYTGEPASKFPYEMTTCVDRERKDATVTELVHKATIIPQNIGWIMNFPWISAHQLCG